MKDSDKNNSHILIYDYDTQTAANGCIDKTAMLQ